MKTIKIFLSSTSKDLFDHRNELLQHAKYLGYEIIAMEEFGAQDGHALEVSLKAVRECDVFIGIYARRYGFIPVHLQETMSVTEAEYHEACRSKKPRLIFVAEPNYVALHPLLNLHRDDSNSEVAAKLEGFLQKIALERVWDVFTSPEDLAERFKSALSKWEGWRRPMPVAPSRKMIGNADLLAQLKTVLSTTRRIVVSGIGGNGKTLLTQCFVQQYADQYTAGVLWFTLNLAEKNPAVWLQRFLFQAATCSHEGRVTAPESLTVSIIRKLFKEAPGEMLVVIDNAWSVEILQEILQAIPENINIMLTTRDASILKGLSQFENIPVPTLNEQDSLRLLQDRGNDWVTPSILKKLAVIVNGHPLTLELVAGLIKKNGVDYAEEQLPNLINYKIKKGDERLDESWEPEYAALTASLSLTYDTLSESMKERFRTLSITPSGAILPIALVASLWKMDAVEDMQEDEDLWHFIGLFVQLGLLNRDENTNLSFHPLLHRFGKGLLQVDEIQHAHTRYADFLSKHLSPALKQKHPDWSGIATSLPHLHQIGDYFYAAIAKLAGDPLTTVTPEMEFPVEDAEIASIIAVLRHPELPNSIWMRATSFVIMASRYTLMRSEIGQVGLQWLCMGVVAAKELGNTEYCVLLFNQIARWYSERGQGEKALSFEERTRNWFFKENAPIQDQAVYLNNTGWSLYLQGRWEEAMQHYRQALAILGEDNPQSQAIHNNMGELYRQLGDSEKAEYHLLQSIALEKSDAENEEEGRSYRNLGLVYRDQGAYDKAIEYYQKALLIAENQNHTINQAEVLKAMAGTYLAKGDTALAASFANQAMPFVEASGALKSISGAHFLWGDIYHANKRFTEALESFDKALRIEKELNAPKGIGDVLNNMASVYVSLNDYDQALKLYQEVLVMSEEMGDTAGAAITKSNIGGVLLHKGALEEAQTFLLDCLPVLQRSKNKKIESFTLLHLANLYRKLGDNTQANTYVEQAQKVFAGMDSVFQDVQILFEEGVQLASWNKHTQAIEKFQSAANLCNNQPYLKKNFALCHNQLGLVYIQIKQYEKAEFHFQQAGAVLHELGDEEQEAQVWNNLGEICRISGRKEEAKVYYEKALPILRNSDKTNALADILNNLALVCSPRESDRRVAMLEECADLKIQIGHFQGAVLAYHNIVAGLIKQNQHNEAITYLRKAGLLIPQVTHPVDRLDLQINTGCTFAQPLELNEEAAGYFEQALQTMQDFQIQESTEGWTPFHLQNLILKLQVNGSGMEDDTEHVLETIFNIMNAESLKEAKQRLKESPDLLKHPIFEAISGMLDHTGNAQEYENMLLLHDFMRRLQKRGIEDAYEVILGKRALESAVKCLENDDPKEALHLLEKARRFGFRSQTLYLTYGVAFLHTGDEENALEYLDSAAEEYEDNWAVYYWQGRVLLDKMPEMALSKFNQAINLLVHPEPEEIEEKPLITIKTHGFMASYYQKDHGIHIYPPLEDIYFQRATANFKQNEYAETIADLNFSIQLQPNRYAYYLYRGASYMQLGKYKQAQDDLYTATELETHDATLYLLRAQAFIRNDDPVGALEDLDWALHIEVTEQALFQRSMIYFGLGEWNAAREDFEHIRRLTPHHADSLYWDGIRAFIEKDSEKSLEFFLTSHQYHPASANTCCWIALIYLDLKKVQNAAEALQEALRLDPEDSLVSFWRGVVCLLQKDAIQGQRLLYQTWKTVEPLADEDNFARRLGGRIHALDRTIDDAKAYYQPVFTGVELEILQIETSMLDLLARLFPQQPELENLAVWFRQCLEEKIEDYHNK